ncbi:hypothetical protein B046DRAFT_00577 [Streptomyces sp. LamerLS-316]|nr:hypothetical protein B046DRAFT_00577 [Streptomyces sp. LamerLS-316]
MSRTSTTAPSDSERAEDAEAEAPQRYGYAV